MELQCGAIINRSSILSALRHFCMHLFIDFSVIVHFVRFIMYYETKIILLSATVHFK